MMPAFRLSLLFFALMSAFAHADNTPAPTDPVPTQNDPKPQKNKKNKNNKKDDKPLKYPVSVHTGDSEMTELLQTHLPLIQYQRKEDLDKEQIGYLAEDAPDDARNILRTEGYFNTQIQVSPQGEGYEVRADLGKRTHIGNVSVAIGGDIVQDPQLGNYYKTATEGWKLPVGNPFRQEDWTASKVSVLSAVTRKKYPLAKLTHTQATVNPQTHSADLNVNVESGAPVYFGELDISGVQRYPDSVVRGLADFKAGDPYDLDKLLDYQQALENNSHYSGASVQADFERISDGRVPVKVSVSELKKQKFEAGLRFDSEYGLGGNIGYDHYNLFGRGYVGSVFVEADKYQTKVGAGISQPRSSKGNYFTSNLSYNRSTTQKLEKRAWKSGIWHVRERGNTEIRYGVEFIAENSRIPDSTIVLGKSHATMLTASWKRQNIETQMRPANGYYFDGKVGTTLGKLMSSALMARASANAGYYFTPENKQLGTLALRGNLGYVYTNKKEAAGEVPADLMFRTGGAGSVRGYELDSIGRRLPDSTAVLPDRAMAVASLEYQYPIKDSFAAAVFHDMGGTGRQFKDIRFKHGSGVGVRWFSPVAPFSFDIAYGHHDKRLRWHISLGTRF
ncbi:autotransporter assembly complex protein TamA [Conchiformibius steedae DSM 2580]|uniref:Autotransporter assembly complex protein TamA n=3 Tax=Conchiformibius steedae TaxID=153493 RepID=A0AAE9HY19_9NEIS|nr:autotransporter assembly complex family protein [Conchiformibius steedae]QMT34489.1 outer membrane protein assembly factor [Conchiformibius steedae]URD68580.1 autotransporter assembly complex protein TamA [Conchiformibius steedae DSM 2580]